MQEKLSTGPGASKPESVLSGALLSKADDCVDLVFSVKPLNTSA